VAGQTRLQDALVFAQSAAHESPAASARRCLVLIVVSVPAAAAPIMQNRNTASVARFIKISTVISATNPAALAACC
jgi:hypothetical protein